MPSLRGRAFFWAVVALVVNVPFLLWLLSVPPRASCEDLVGLPFDNCQISHSGRGLTIAVIVFAWLLADAGLGALIYTSWTGSPIGSEAFRRYGGMWGGNPTRLLLWFRIQKWRRE